MDVQKDSEKSLAEHEMDRFESANSTLNVEVGGNDDDKNEIAAADILKQNVLATPHFAV